MHSITHRYRYRYRYRHSHAHIHICAGKLASMKAGIQPLTFMVWGAFQCKKAHGIKHCVEIVVVFPFSPNYIIEWCAGALHSNRTFPLPFYDILLFTGVVVVFFSYHFLVPLNAKGEYGEEDFLTLDGISNSIVFYVRHIVDEHALI